MTPVVPGLSVEVVWFDADMLELSFKACSTSFAGSATFYAALDEAERLARHIEGFPLTPGDTREYEFGSSDVTHHGGARLSLSCSDGTGHLLVRATVYRTSDSQPVRVVESATIEFASVPSAVDSFVADLRRMRGQVGDAAFLNYA